jgi:hypothetical protein
MLNLSEAPVRPVRLVEERRFQEPTQEHHYPGALPKISDTLWYAAIFDEQWIALICLSAATLKCSARDQWIG